MATLVFFHAHPDDEALLTAGTMARAAAAGQRVVLVVATDGAAGLAASAYQDLATTRAAELATSADALGVARTVWLPYADSGLHGDRRVPPDAPQTLCSVPVPEAAAALAAVLTEEAADVLVTYDANGGYGHPDHVRAHQVAVAAAELAGTGRVFEATVPRDLLLRGIRLAARVYRFPPEFDPTSFERAFTAAADITHRVDVRAQLPAKRAAMAAHTSQATADGGDRTLAAFLRMPKLLYRTVFGTEWYRLR
ncbi:MAG TPA: PIG-L family deacetylase [Candidatus Nanopelagicales bacterium]|nr:PIG-L family deacetylase [Candidatus Nanopelagicales bacterium]